MKKTIDRYTCNTCGKEIEVTPSGNLIDDETFRRDGWYVLQRLAALGYVMGTYRNDYCSLKCLRIGVAGMEDT